jgi:hypothetical protein
MMDRESERGVARLKRGAARAEAQGGAGRGAKAGADRVMKSRSRLEASVWAELVRLGVSSGPAGGRAQRPRGTPISAQAGEPIRFATATENETSGRGKRGRRVWARRSRTARPRPWLEGR